ncbi:MAG: RluA family pseudouridine synthase [Desulfocapsaceae bacterium]
MKDSRRPKHPKKKKLNVSSFTLEKQDTLLSSLIGNLPHKNRKNLKAVLKDGQVTIDNEVVRQFDHPLRPGQRVEVKWDRDLKGKHLCALDIVHIDQDIVVINKPSGLLTIATDKEKRKTAYSILSNFVKQEHPDNKIFIVHRIDRETSGLLMFARSEKVKRQIQKTWNATIRERTYIGVVQGKVTPPEGTITSWLTESKAFIVYSSEKKGAAGKRAVTHYKKIMGTDAFSLLQINLETGRKHQIRVHMQDLGHPVIGDKKYGSHLNPLKRMGLHAQVLAFTHPTTKELCRFDTGIPQKFLKLLAPETKRGAATKNQPARQ